MCCVDDGVEGDVVWRGRVSTLDALPFGGVKVVQTRHTKLTYTQMQAQDKQVFKNREICSLQYKC